MNIRLHKNARTTPAIRREIQAATGSDYELAERFGVKNTGQNALSLDESRWRGETPGGAVDSPGFPRVPANIRAVSTLPTRNGRSKPYASSRTRLTSTRPTTHSTIASNRSRSSACPLCTRSSVM